MRRTPQIAATVVSLLAAASAGQASPAPRAGITLPPTTLEHPAISEAARAQILDQHAYQQQAQVYFREIKYTEWTAPKKSGITRGKRKKKTSDVENLPANAPVASVFEAMRPIAPAAKSGRQS